jgi:hypothetical protein
MAFSSNYYFITVASGHPLDEPLAASMFHGWETRASAIWRREAKKLWDLQVRYYQRS